MHTHTLIAARGWLFLPLALALAAGGCGRKSEPPAPAATAASADPPPTNRVDINASVRQNLGITFAVVESRAVSRTLRVPGRFELLPTARREYRVAAAGAVELLVEQYQRVDAGAPLYRLDSPRWRELQRELTDAQAAVTLAQAAVASIGPYTEAHEKHHTELQQSVAVWTQRVTDLERLRAAGGARGDDVSQAQASLANARAALAETFEKEAELNARAVEARAQLEAASTRARILLESAASLAGMPADELAALDNGAPRWQSISAIEVRAIAPGVIDALHAVSGSVVDQHAPVLATVQPDLVRFRAHGLQSDMGKLTDGLPATVVAPQGGSLAAGDSVAGRLTLAPTADHERRTIELVMTPAAGARPQWARAGVSAFLEIVTAGSGANDLAIPLACVTRDGAKSIIFRRDPANPDKAIRMEADLGADDGRWVAIRSGVGEGNEIVLDGVYPLMVATSGSITRGGHFHPDGTFHEGDE